MKGTIKTNKAKNKKRKDPKVSREKKFAVRDKNAGLERNKIKRGKASSTRSVPKHNVIKNAARALSQSAVSVARPWANKMNAQERAELKKLSSARKVRV